MDKVKNRKILIVISIATVCAIVTGILLYLFLAPQRTTIYTFKDNYEAGTRIDASMLAPLQVDSNVILAGASTETSSYYITDKTYSSYIQEGDTLKKSVVKGEALMVTSLTDSGNSGIEVLMDKASIAVTIPVDNITGVSPAIKAESHINIYATYNSGGTYLILENMRVLGVTVSNGSLSGITIECDSTESAKVINAINTGAIYCGIVNADGYVYVTTEETAPKQ